MWCTKIFLNQGTVLSIKKRSVQKETARKIELAVAVYDSGKSSI